MYNKNEKPIKRIMISEIKLPNIINTEIKLPSNKQIKKKGKFRN